jgi:uncharacterized tellurite resistance protein B-like protein
VIIWGTRGVTTVAQSGSFHCPSCNDRRSYAHKRVRRFFTLYFIPMIPLEQLGDFVECQTCKGTFKEAVLSYDPTAEKRAFMTAFRHALRRVSMEMLATRAQPSADELAAVRESYRAVFHEELDPAALSAEMGRAAADTRPLTEHLSGLAGGLNDVGREALVRAAAAVARADGPLRPDEHMALGKIATALKVTPSHLTGILGEARAQ